MWLPQTQSKSWSMPSILALIREICQTSSSLSVLNQVILDKYVWFINQRILFISSIIIFLLGSLERSQSIWTWTRLTVTTPIQSIDYVGIDLYVPVFFLIVNFMLLFLAALLQIEVIFPVDSNSTLTTNVVYTEVLSGMINPWLYLYHFIGFWFSICWFGFLVSHFA